MLIVFASLLVACLMLQIQQNSHLNQTANSLGLPVNQEAALHQYVYDDAFSSIKL